MNVRAATAQDAAGIVALHKAANPYGDWYRDPLRRLARAAYEDLTPFERYLHGGFWMDLSLFRRHLYEYERRGFPVLVAEDAGRVVGECELWLDEEPDPFGRYAEVAFLEAGSPPKEAVERALLERAGERVRRLGYPALDLSPKHSGGESVAKSLGFRPIWDTRTFTADPKSVDPPEEEFKTRFLAGDYGDLRGLLALDHREPARWRYETLSARWPAAQVAGLPDATKLVGVAVDAPDARFAVLAARREWLDPSVAEIDVWVDPPVARAPARLATIFRISAEIARRLGAKRLETYAPPSAAKALKGIGFRGGGKADPWMRRTL